MHTNIRHLKAKVLVAIIAETSEQFHTTAATGSAWNLECNKAVASD